MKIIFLLSFILTLSSCNNFLPFTKHESPEYEKIADRITAKVVQKIETETGLTFCGIGGGMMDQINMMALSFRYKGEITIDQGRELLTYCINEYLRAINEDSQIKPYLVHFPFTAKDIEIEIFLSKSNGEELPFGTLLILSEANGIMKYKTRDPFSKRLKTIYKESYEEAIKALETGGTIKKSA